MDVSYRVTGEMENVDNVMVDYIASGVVIIREDFPEIPCVIGYTECNGSIEPAYVFTENYVDENGKFYSCKMIEL